MFICEKCGKEYNHKGDYEKHVILRKSSCIKRGQALIDRLAAVENALKTAGVEVAKLNIIEAINTKETEEPNEIHNMNYPLSKKDFEERVIGGEIMVGANKVPPTCPYDKYVQAFCVNGKLKEEFTEEKLKKYNKHDKLDDLIKLFNMYDLMRTLPKSAKMDVKRGLIMDYFNGKFNKADEDNVAPAAPAIPAEVVELVVNPNDTKEAAALKTMFTRFEQMLYNEGTVGTKARDDIVYLMILKMLEPVFSDPNKSDIMDIKKNNYENLEIEGGNIKYILMNELGGLKSEEIRSELQKVWKHVLSQHKQTKQIFDAEKFLQIKSDTCLMSMLVDLNRFNFKNCPLDVLGSVYEHFIHKQFKGEQGSKLGQHFTPKTIVNFIINNFFGEYNENHRLADPFSGTGGFLIEMYEQSKKLNGGILNNIGNKLFATEIDSDVFRYAKANLLIRTGDLCENIVRCSAFEIPEIIKYDKIITNPPFGLQLTDKTTFNKTTWFNQAKIKNGNMVCLQYNMHMLAEGGVCSMVWPYGSECYSSNKTLNVIRERLFTEFDVMSVVLLPKGVFEYTSIATLILTFRKPLTGEKVVPKLKMYQYKEGAQKLEDLEIIADADAETLKNKHYMIKPETYKEKIVQVIRPEFEMKRLGDICELKNGKYNSGDMDNNGDIPFYSCSSKNPVGLHSNETFNKPDYLLIVGSGGSQNNKSGDNVGLGNVYHVHGKTACRSQVFGLFIRKDNLNINYLYHYLKLTKSKIADLASFTTNLGMISKTELENLQIPVPPPEMQTEIVSVVSQLEANIKALDDAIKGFEFQITLLSKRQFRFKEGEFEMKKLGDVCDFANGQNITIGELKDGIYPAIGGGKKPMGMHNTFNTPANTILVSKDGAYAGYVAMYSMNVFINNSCMKILPKEIMNNMFVYYYLKYVIQQNIYDLQEGTAQPHVYSSGLKELQIPVPSAELQLKFIEFYQKIEATISEKKARIELLRECINDTHESIKMQFQ